FVDVTLVAALVKLFCVMCDSIRLTCEYFIKCVIQLWTGAISLRIRDILLWTGAISLRVRGFQPCMSAAYLRRCDIDRCTSEVILRHVRFYQTNVRIFYRRCLSTLYWCDLASVT